MARTWIKIYCFQWISGSLRDENPLIRAVWIDLLALVGIGQAADLGELKIAPNVGLTDIQIAGLMKIPVAMWRRAKARLIETGRIEVDDNNCIKILNWKKYQSEYRRQKQYRDVTNDCNQKLQQEVTNNSYNQTLQDEVTYRDRDRDIDRDREYNNNARTRKKSVRADDISFNHETKEFENIAKEDLISWKQAYPACDVEIELRRAREWLLANPAKARKSNWRRFIVNWLSRTQERGGTRQGIEKYQPAWMQGIKK